VARVDSVLGYYRHNLELLDEANRQDLFGRAGVVYTKIKDQVPAIYGEAANCRNCLVADGCIVEGQVENSVLFRGVHVAPGAVVKNSVIMQSSRIMEGAKVEQVILDKSVTIRSHRHLVGQSEFPVVVGKGAMV
jgi:glucose-1-phosphate adenylyltransferase